jgi:hypothetical protein
MATTTANYGFDVPTSTDLVKNGATQIALLGQDLDTFLFRPFTRNGVINSGFNVWQRGTSISNFGFFTLYTADRWAFLSVNSGRTISRQLTNDTTNLPNIQYCARVQRDSGNTDTTYLQLSQSFETLNSIPFAGKTVTYSFYARKGANYSATSNILVGRFSTGTGTDQSVIAGYTGGIDTDTNFTITSTWQRFSVTLTVPATATEIATTLRYTPTGTAGANDYFEVTGVQLEVGNQASPFVPAGGGSPQAELAMCQRYYQKSYAQATAPATNSQTSGIVFAQGVVALANATALGWVKFPVIMRTSPTVAPYSYTSSTVNTVSNGAGTDLAVNSGQATYIGENGFAAINNSGGLITPSNGGFVFHYIASAEL